ncbi:MAG: hypothetical protein ACRDYC_01465, partial [Acidimicrobiales bacterium]
PTPSNAFSGQTSVTSFAFADSASECVVPVVFVQGAAGATQNLLPLGTNNSPTVPFGVGVTESFTPALAAAGSFGGGGGNIVPSVTGTQDGAGFFVGGGATYTFQSTDSYFLWNSTLPTPTCVADSFADFEARLTLNDQVGGVFNPTAASSFCLNDSAPAVPAVVATKAATSQGVTLTITQTTAVDGTNAIVGYQIFRAAATPGITGAPYTCPASSPLPVNSSPQTPPGAAYTSLAKVNTNNTGTITYTDSTVSAGASTTTPNAYCYAVSPIALAAISGTTETGTAAPASAINPPPLTLGTPTATAPAPEVPANGTTTTNPVFTASGAAGGMTVIVQYNQAINPASVDTNGSQYVVSYVPSGGGATFADPVTAATQTSPNVTLTVTSGIPTGATVTVTAQNGTPTINPPCSAASASSCEAPGDQVQITAGATAVVPKLTSVSASFGGQTVGLAYNQPITCATLTPGDYLVQSPIGTVITATGVINCTGTTSSTAALTFAANALVTGQAFSVTATGLGPANAAGVVEPALDFMSGPVGL